MILSPEQILSILKDKPNSAVLQHARKESKKLRAHINGDGLDHLLTQITGLENEKQLELRKAYARSNKDLFARIHRPEDKVFTAKGGSVYIDAADSVKKQLIPKLKNVYHGFSSRAWVEAFAKQYFHTDPMGLVFMEVGVETVYPTYKSTAKIFDYQLNGRNLEYVIFMTDDPSVYRAVDDQFDYLVKQTGDNIEVINVFPNYFGRVPGIIISDLISDDPELYTSPDWEIIELADEFLRECSVKSVYKLKHGYPKAWQYKTECYNCKGTGYHDGESCNVCNGTGFGVSKDTSETLSIPIPTADQPSITPDVAGYISPDVEGWTKMTEELSALENLMHSTYWGIKDRVKTVGLGNEKTATEIIDDMQPLNDRLFRFSKWAEGIESFITNSIAEFFFANSYKGISINYGRRYMIESADKIWEKYENARTKGAPVSILDELMIEYIYSKYSNNALELEKYLKLMKVEPFVHQTIAEAKNTVLDPAEYNRKLYFSEWLNQINENDILIKSVPELTSLLTEYTNQKQITNVQN